jgi:hypothetical protein
MKGDDVLCRRNQTKAMVEEGQLQVVPCACLVNMQLSHTEPPSSA